MCNTAKLEILQINQQTATSLRQHRQEIYVNCDKLYTIMPLGGDMESHHVLYNMLDTYSTLHGFEYYVVEPLLYSLTGKKLRHGLYYTFQGLIQKVYWVDGCLIVLFKTILVQWWVAG